jgi:acyl-CoA dehydrogenase
MVSKVADDGIQILGGYGYSMDFDMQRYWRDTRQLRIGPISNEMAANYLAGTMGLPKSY